jgi:hypothetical protein
MARWWVEKIRTGSGSDRVNYSMAFLTSEQRSALTHSPDPVATAPGSDFWTQNKAFLCNAVRHLGAFTL